MITKREFVDIIERLKEVYDFVDETNARARNLSIEFNSMHLTIQHEDIVLELLDNMFDTDWISYWIYELDYGRNYKEGCIQEEKDGKMVNIDLSTAEKLYDYLIEEMKSKNDSNA